MRPVDSQLWSATLRHYSTYEEAQLVEIVRVLAELRWGVDATKLVNVVGKYSCEEHHCVADVMALTVRDLRFDFQQQEARTPCGSSLLRTGSTGSSGASNLTTVLSCAAAE